MSTKRQSLKGKGASIFLGLDKKNHNTTKPEHLNTIKPAKQIKATYFINDSIVDKLEEVCFALKRKLKNKKINKSKLVELALINFLGKWEQNKDNNPIEEIIKNNIK